MTQVEFCVISPWSLSRFLSNHQKALLRWLLHPHNNFQLIPLSGLPCRRDNKSILFTRIIGHNSRTIHWICTKFDARIRLWTPFLCAKCQGDRSTYLRFIAIVVSVRKHDEKNKEKKLKLWQLVSRKWLE